eukprot:SAG31_NODE_941_length_10868_cov_9.232241_3_plen_76_part_00
MVKRIVHGCTVRFWYFETYLKVLNLVSGYDPSRNLPADLNLVVANPDSKFCHAAGKSRRSAVPTNFLVLNLVGMI